MIKEIEVAEAKRLLNHFIDTNKKLQDDKQTPIAVSLVGSHGIGKTAIVQQVAEERDMGFVKLSLHELEEVGDLVGYPIKEYHIVRKKPIEGKKNDAWVSADVLSKINNEEWSNTSEPPRMGYAKPGWVPKFNKNGTILLLDDYARSSQMLVQATMELINTGKYVSWSLPKYTTVVLTANPDNGEFNVNSMDPAQKDRFVEFDLEFNIGDWARWAEMANIDNRAINFALNYSSDLFEKKNGVTIATPRGFVTFCKAIGSLPDWKKSLAMITLISRGCFNDKDGAVGNIFASFVANGYDKLISPREIFEQGWDTVSKKLKHAIYGDDENSLPNTAIASMFSIRIVNYLDAYFSKPGYESKPIVTRLTELFESGLFSEDLMFHVIKTSISNHPQQLSKLMQNPNITEKIIL